jgi:colicin import membrane protein
MYAPDPEQQPVAAGVLTAVVHIVFAAILFLSMSWQQDIRQQASVKLWKSMPTTPVKAERPRKRTPVKPVNPAKPARPDFDPTPTRAKEQFTQATPAAVAPAIPTPSPIVDVARPVTPATAPLRADLAAPKREHVDKPMPDSINSGSGEPPPTYTPTQVAAVSQPVEPQIEASRADLAAPVRERVDQPAPDSLKVESVEPPPTYTPTQITAVSQPVEPQIEASRADLATPVRERVDQPAPDSLKVESAEPPPTYTPTRIAAVSQPVKPEIAPPRTDIAAPVPARVEKTAPARVSTKSVAPRPAPTPTQIEERPDRKPEVDVDALRRERALALAEQLREEETSRLNETLERERIERDEKTKRREARESKLARELQEISAAAQQRRSKLESQQAQDAAASGLADDYRARISAKIRQRVILPPDMEGNPQAIYEVSLLPGGQVTRVHLLQSSGVLTYDAAVERAIMAAQPLPVPEDPELFHAIFKNFFLSFRPKE